jgi:hypothetical protein
MLPFSPAFQQSIERSAPDVDARVNQLARPRPQSLLNYMHGNTALGVYRDSSAAGGGTFVFLTARLSALPVYLPALNEYLLEYPKARSGNVQARFY